MPTTVADFSSLLNNDEVLNADYTGIGIISSDNFFITYTSWMNRQPIEQNAYLWKADIYECASSADWDYPYLSISYANVILDGLDKISFEGVDAAEWKRVKGSALFRMAYAV